MLLHKPLQLCGGGKGGTAVIASGKPLGQALQNMASQNGFTTADRSHHNGVDAMQQEGQSQMA